MTNEDKPRIIPPKLWRYPFVTWAFALLSFAVVAYILSPTFVQEVIRGVFGLASVTP